MKDYVVNNFKAINSQYAVGHLSTCVDLEGCSFETMMFEKYPSISPYTYCANNPVMFVDPTGMESIRPPTKMDYNTLEKNYNKAGQDILKSQKSLNYLANRNLNTCAIKMSYAFNLSGYSVDNSKETPSNVRIQNGKKGDVGNFVLDANSMYNYLSNIEKPTYSYNNIVSEEDVNNVIDDLHKYDDLKAIVILVAGDQEEYGATGHVDLLYEDFMWDLSLYSSSGSDLKPYLNDNLKSKLSIYVWILEYDE